MPQHACIAIGIDRYRYMQPLRYALEDAREFHAAIAQLETSETRKINQSSLNLGTLNGWSQTGAENGNGNGNGSTNGNSPIAPPIATLTPFTIPVPDDDPPHHDRHLLLTETSPQVSDRSTYPTREAILHALYRWTSDTVTPDQTLWCFFSGYGLEVDGVDYLLPIEGNPNRLDETAIPIETVFDALAAAPTDRVVLILDINRPTSADRDSDIGLQTYTLAKTRNIPTILSCQPHQRSYETRDLRHGLFSAVLLEALRHRKCPTLESLERYLIERVPELCNLHLQPTQTPLMAIGDRGRSSLILFDTTTPKTLDRDTLDRDTMEVNLTPDPDLDLDSTLALEVNPNYDFAPTSPVLPAVPALEPIGLGTDNHDTEAIDPAIVTPSEPSDRDVRSLLGLGSSVLVWLGLFGSVLGLGVWLNDRVGDTAIESEVPTAIVPPQANQTPPTAGVAGSPSNTPSHNTSETGDATQADPAANLPDNRPSDDRPSDDQPATETTKPLNAEPSQALNQAPNPASNLSPSPSPNPNTPQTSTLTPALDPSTIASMYSLQASPLSAAIAQARNLKPNDPGHNTRKQNIERWGTTIFEIAQSRADRGQWLMAIAAARLVPPELDAVKDRADRSIQWWTQAQVNEQIIAAARKTIEPNQVSSYWRAIERLRSIKTGQPFDETARAQIETWAADMVTIARQRAAKGQTASAIQAAQLVPRQTIAYTDARRELKRWQSPSP